MSKKTITILAITFLLTLGLGILIGIKIGSGKNLKIAEKNANGEDMQKLGLPALPADVEVKNVTGTVQQISNNSITLKLFASDPLLAGKNEDVLIVHTDGNTKFYQFAQRDMQQYQKEMEDYNKKLQERAANIIPPMPQEKKEIQLSDIKEGKIVTVSSNDNIRDKKEFTAAEISVQFFPEISVPQNLPNPSEALPQGSNQSSLNLPPPPAPSTASDRTELPPPPASSAGADPTFLPPPPASVK